MRNLVIGATLLAACGGGSGDDADDVGPDASDPAACSELESPTATISQYPGTASGSVSGAGADLSAAEGACTQEGSWYDAIGSDSVVALTGLSNGGIYKVTLTAADDLSMYVITGCDDTTAMPGTGECLMFDDTGVSGDGEINGFVATGSDAYLVVDTYDDTGLTTGAFTVAVEAGECIDNTQCSGATPICVDFACVECGDDFDCDSDTPVCSGANACEAGASSCTGDDARDNAPEDDGPANAFLVTAPTVGVPTTVTGNVCNVPATEADWYKFTLAAEGDVGFDLTATGVDVNFDVFDGMGEYLGTAGAVGDEHIRANDFPADTYYVRVFQATPANTMAATAYSLTLRVPDCDTSFDCETAGAPYCIGSGTCGVGPDECDSDDAGDTTLGGDDGPAGATLLVSGVSLSTSTICAPEAGGETDFYKIDVAAAHGLTVSLGYTQAGTPPEPDLDLYVYDSEGTMYGYSFWKVPETVTLSNLPAGTVYIQVQQYSPEGTVPNAYTITATDTGAGTCTTSDDCDNVYSTQVYRSQCSGNVCSFYKPDATVANGEPCDSDDDCTSGFCSNFYPFEADAHKSVCTDICDTDADCTFGSGLKCITDATLFDLPLCVPSCGSNLDCGAITGSSTLDSGEPWDYLSCTVATGACSLAPQ